MSAFRDLMSIVDPNAPKTTPAPRQAAPPVAPKPVSRPAGGANGVAQSPQLKRKASGPVESSQVKVQRKDQPAPGNGAGRPTATPSAARPNPPPALATIPYRGTAAPAGAKLASPVVKKPISQANTPSVAPKAASSAPKPAPPAATSSSSTSTSAAPKKGYLALLQKAKEKDATKPVTPPVQHGPTKILTKKERLALKAEATASAKGKKPLAGASAKITDAKTAAGPEKKKSVEVGYQGTARPLKQPVQAGYKGTARPASVPASTSRNGTPAARSKPQPAKGRYDGYADWSDLDDMEDEEDYDSEGSSDMEGGVWDLQEEEQLALKAAKQEDAEALAEENRLKREKEERKRKLLALEKKAAAKRKY
ncbi:hypothetical protein ACEQ8H_008657 [Pleosporales sp. CAS-2024a]